jgi:hypothetical protein
MEREKTCPKTQKNTSAIKFVSLKFQKCIFMTDDQFNKQQIHKPKETLFIEKKIKVNSTIDIDNAIEQMINEIHINLNNVYKKSVKIPHPIFVMLGRELEIESNLFDAQDTFFAFPINPLDTKETMEYGNTTVPKKAGQIAIIDYLNGYFKSGFSTTSDKYKYDTSIVNSYKFIGNVRIYLYVPYLTNKYTFISNLNDLSNSFYFFNAIINSNFYMNITRTSTFNSDKFRDEMEKNKLSSDMIDFLIKIISSTDKYKYPLYDDLVNLCFDGGCVSDIGDDFNTLIPSYIEDDEDTNNKNASDKSPFMPNKCLSKTNGFLCNIRYANKNKDIHPFIKDNLLKEIKENLTKYTLVAEIIKNKGELDEKQRKDLDKYKSPVDLVVSIINNFIKKYYSNNLKDKDKDDIKFNHYSKEYSENIIKELAFLKKMNGIPEFVMSLYIFKDELKTDKIKYMPFVKNYPTDENIFNFGDILKVDQILYSFNKQYGMKLNSNGFVSIFNIKTGEILYFLNKEIINDPIDMTVQENGLLISFMNSQGNIINRNYLYNISSLVENCELCNPPFTLIITDNGLIRIYGNGYYDATSKDLIKLIEDEINFIKNYNESRNRNGEISKADINNISSIEKSLKRVEVEKKNIYCSAQSIAEGCKT